MAHPYLSIIIPAYNEAERIPQTLIAVDRALEGAEFSYEILVADNGSTDVTRDIVARMAHVVRNLRLADGGTGGKGIAVRNGMIDAFGVVRLFMDADNATQIDQFMKMMPLFKEGYDVVIGSRTVRGAAIDRAEPWYRVLGGKALNIVVQLLLLPGLWDTQCGFKAFTADAAERIFATAKVPGWAFDVEALALAKRFGYRIKEVPVRWAHDPRSRVDFASSLRFIAEVFQVRWRLWRGEYSWAGLDRSPRMR
jgi:glycosyltransferase involved in cell wall biosynthesis